jgi:hypothetical protein
MSVGFSAPDLATPYTQQWDLGIEREITRSMGITVSYLGSRGLKFYYTRDLNMGAMGPNVTYRINDISGNQTGTYTTPTYLFANRVDKNFQRVTQLENGGRMWYDGLVVQLRRRAGKWMQGNVSYTWSHARDLNQGGGSNNLFFDPTDFPRTIFNGDYSSQKGTSPLDQRHRLVMSGLISPPRIKAANKATDLLMNDWQMTFIATIASARYATPTIAVSALPFTGAAFTSTLNGSGGDNRVPFWARTSLPIDDVARVDARMMKSFRIQETMRLTFSFEAFNVFNNVSDTSVFTQAMTSSGNVIRPVSSYGGGSASQGFPDGTNARRAQIGLRFVF